MKNLIRLSLVLVIALLSQSVVMAQEAVFRVIASRGNVTRAKMPLTIGKKLYPTDKIELPASAYLGLMHKSGRTVEIKTPGTYSVEDLDKKLSGNGKIGVNTKFASFVVEQISKDDEKDIVKNHQLYMGVTGAVQRALPKSLSSDLEPLIPQTSILPDKNYKVTWFAEPGVAEYVVTVYDLSETPVQVINVKDTTVVLPLGVDLKKRNEDLCFVEVKAKNNPTLKSSPHPVKLLPSTFSEQINLALKELDALEEENTAASKIGRAMYFEDHDLHLDALIMYQEAITAAPDVPDYKILYHDFLKRAGLLNIKKAGGKK